MGTATLLHAAGFAAIGVRLESGAWLYHCDGMPTTFGCPSVMSTDRRIASTGTKRAGWLVLHGLHRDDTEDHDVVLVYCPACAATVRQQEHRKHGHLVGEDQGP